MGERRRVARASDSGTPPPTRPRSREGSKKVSPSPLRGGGGGAGLIRPAPPRLKEGSKNLSPSPLRGGGRRAGLLPRLPYPTSSSVNGSTPPRSCGPKNSADK